MAITTDICTINWRQEFIAGRGIPLEHPRTGTTNDVECFFFSTERCSGQRLKGTTLAYLHGCTEHTKSS